MENKYVGWIPAAISEETGALGLSVNELLIVFAFAYLAFFLTWTMAIAAVGVFFAIRKAKEKTQRGFVALLVYLVGVVQLNNLPIATMREFVE